MIYEDDAPPEIAFAAVFVTVSKLLDVVVTIPLVNVSVFATANGEPSVAVPELVRLTVNDFRLCDPLTNFSVPSAPMPVIFNVAPVASPLKPFEAELLAPPTVPLRFRVF